MIKKLIFIFLIILSFNIGIKNINAKNNDFLGKEKIIEELKGSNKSLVPTIEDYISYLLLLLYFLAVIYGIYGGFLILTASDDDDKVKKGKTVIIQGVIGLVIIFLAGAISRFVLILLEDNKIDTKKEITFIK